MDEARRLADKYAPEEMEEYNLNQNMRNAALRIGKDIKTYRRMKKKIEEKKNTLPSHILDAMEMTLELMKETVGTEQFRLYRSAVLNLSRGYNIFFRGRKK